MDDKKDKKFDIKEILKDKQKRAIIILGIYFIFFIFLVASIRSNYKTRPSDKTATTINKENAPEKIQLDSYNFEYKIMSNGELYTYSGKKYGNKKQFSYNNNEYFMEDNIYYKKTDAEWIEVDNPFVYSEYLDFNLLNSILSKVNMIPLQVLKMGKLQQVIKCT